MTTPTVRKTILDEVTRLQAPMTVFDLSDFLSIKDLPFNDVGEAILIDFVAANERMITIGGDGNQGWEEDGTTAIHWICPTGFKSEPILLKCEALRLKLRGRRLGSIVLEAVEPFMDSGSDIDIDGGWTAFSSLIHYSRNTCG